METNNLKTIYFDGESYILFSRFANFPKESFTIEFWVKKETKNCLFLEFVDDELVNFNTDLGFSFVDDKLVVTLFDVELKTLYAIDNSWHHVSIVFKRSDNEIYMYLDGYPIDFVKPATDFSLLKYSGKGDIYIGRKAKDAVFEGYIRNLRIWNVARSGMEIRQKMSITLMDFEDTMVGMWNFSSMNEIESKLGVRLPQSFAEQEKNLAAVIKKFYDPNTPNDQQQGKEAINAALRAALDIFKTNATSVTQGDDKSKISEIRANTTQSAFEVRKDTKSADIKVDQLEKVSAALKDGLVEAAKVADLKTLLSEELDSFFSAEKDWFRIFINNESKTCIINLSKSPLDNSITLDLQNISSRNIDVDQTVKFQIGLRNLLPADQIEEIKKSRSQYPVERIKNKLGTGISSKLMQQLDVLKNASFTEQLDALKKMEDLPTDELEKIAAYSMFKAGDIIDIDLVNFADNYKSECLVDYKLSPIKEDVLEIKFKEKFSFERNDKIRFRFKNIYAGDTSREGYLVVETIQEKKDVIATVLASQAIFGVFLLPFLGRLPLENGIVGRNELYYPSATDASSDKIKNELVFYFANPGLDGLISRKALKSGKLLVTSSVHFDEVSAHTACASPQGENRNSTKWGNAAISEQANSFIAEFDVKLGAETEFMFESLEMLVVRIVGCGDRNYPEFIPITFDFKGFGGYNQTIFECFARNMAVESNLRSFNNHSGDHIGIGVSNPLLSLSLGHKNMGFNAEHNAQEKNRFDQSKQNDLEQLNKKLVDTQADLDRAQELAKPDPVKLERANNKKSDAEAQLAAAKTAFDKAQQDVNQFDSLYQDAHDKVNTFINDKSIAEAQLPQAQADYQYASQSYEQRNNDFYSVQWQLSNQRQALSNLENKKNNANWFELNLRDFDGEIQQIQNTVNSLEYDLQNRLTWLNDATADRTNKENTKNRIETLVYNAEVNIRNAEQYKNSVSANLENARQEFNKCSQLLRDAEDDDRKAAKAIDKILYANDEIRYLSKEIEKIKHQIAEVNDRKLNKTEIAIYGADEKEKLRINKDGLEIKGNLKVEENLNINGRVNGNLKIENDLNVGGRVKDKMGYLMPVGSIIAYSSSTPPEGWLLCNGGWYDTNQYPDLYHVLNSSSLPDLRDRFLVGAGNSYGVGNTGGQNWVTLSESQMPSHKHYGFGEGYNDWPLGISGSNNNDGSRGGRDFDNYLYGTTSTGGNDSHENRPPFYALTYIIKY